MMVKVRENSFSFAGCHVRDTRLRARMSAARRFAIKQVCVRTWAKRVDWRSVASMLNQLDAWEIAER